MQFIDKKVQQKFKEFNYYKFIRSSILISIRIINVQLLKVLMFLDAIIQTKAKLNLQTELL